MSESSLQGLIVLITGGGSGIGLATAKLCLQSGAKVAICGRDLTRLADAEKVLQPFGSKLLTIQCDVLIKPQVTAMMAQIEAYWGGLDVLVNNAGGGRVSTFESTSESDWEAELGLKFFGVIRPTRAALPMLKRSKNGAIVNINSLLATQPEPHMVATSAARAGLLNLTKSMAREFVAAGIRVNSILLGLVESGQWHRRHEQDNSNQDWPSWSAELALTKGIPMARLGRPEEAAQAVVFLASPAASYTTGSCLDVSGGLDRHV